MYLTRDNNSLVANLGKPSNILNIIVTGWVTGSIVWILIAHTNLEHNWIAFIGVIVFDSTYALVKTIIYRFFQ